MNQSPSFSSARYTVILLLILMATGCQVTEKIGRPLDKGVVAIRELEKVGKGEGGQFKLVSLLEDQQQLQTTFKTGYFQIEDEQTATFVLLDDNPHTPKQVVVIRYFWRPRAQTGKTHLDPNATNSTITYYILSGEEAGIYRGAGMSRIFGDKNDRILRFVLYESHLNLTDQSLAFQDLLTKADLSGAALLRQDPIAVNRVIDHITRLTAKRLGYMPIATSVQDDKSKIRQ